MRCLKIIIFALVLCGCVAQQDALTSAATDCIRHEAAKVAGKPVDVNTAATTVVARCHAELSAEERGYFDKHASLQEYRAELFLRLRDARVEQAREAVALARTN